MLEAYFCLGQKYGAEGRLFDDHRGAAPWNFLLLVCVIRYNNIYTYIIYIYRNTYIIFIVYIYDISVIYIYAHIYIHYIFIQFIYTYVPYIELMHDTGKALLDHRNGSFEVCPVCHFF
jgi:hypothetical protein